MPKSVLTRKRSLIARFAVLAMVFSLMAVALPASAHSVALDTTGPCPAATPSAGFTDIGGHDATTQTAINCLFAFGITTGTSATTYTPDGVVPRWQMALFLVRQAADHGLTIPAAANQGYTDIGGFDTATQNAINQITQLGISKGTSSTTFSPNLAVSRWQMALFIHRTGVAAGVTFNNTVGHNDFTDIGGNLAEAQTSINALADTRADPEGHIALGTGGSLFSPELPVLRWQMALFLTRLLAADNVAAPSGTRVTVAPTDTLQLNVGQARTYTATYRNPDGTPYTGAIGIQVIDTTAAGAPIFNDTTFAAGAVVVIESATDTLAGVGTTKVTGTAGTDGVVTFTIRVTGAAEQVVPVAWEDLDGDLGYESVGNVPPGEPFGVGGVTNFVAAAAAEATTATHTALVVTKTTKTSDSFEASLAGTDCGNGVGLPCTFRYDANDVFTVDAAAATMADFEGALSTSDSVTVIYNRTTASQSTFTLTDNTAPLTVTDPAAVTSVDAATYAVKGTADPGATVRIYSDQGNDGAIGVGDGIVATGEADADGAWTVNTPLLQNIANDFLARQVPAGGVVQDLVNVPTITEGATAAATITGTASIVNGGISTALDVGDRIDITFSGSVQAPNAGDSVDIQESGVGGTSVRLTCGTNASCSAVSATEIRVTVTAAPIIINSGDNGVVNTAGVIQAMSGYVDGNGLNVNVSGSAAAAKTFTLA